MERTIRQVLRIIDLLREELHAITVDRQLTDPDIVAASRMLDVVLNEYDRLLRERSESN